MSPSQHFFGPVFEDLLHLRHELIGQRAIDEAVVKAEREVADAADGYGVVDHHRRLIDGTDAHDGSLRLIDDRRAYQGAEAAEIGDGEGPSLDFIGLELAAA